MNKTIILVELSVVLTFLLISSAQAQTGLDPNSGGATCSGPVFTLKEITRKAVIISHGFPVMTPEAREHEVQGQVKLEAVLCRNGRVTDIRVIEGLPYGMTEKAVAAALTTKFEPAEMNGQFVSQKIGFEFVFGDGPSSDEIPLDRAAGRLIDRVELVGYRRFEREQIMKWISTRPGEVCDPLTLQRDLAAIVETGYFEKRRTRVFGEEGPQGRLVIIFAVHELPLISELKFEGLTHVSEKVILEALLKEKIDLRKGSVYDDQKIENATRIIRQTLQSNGHREATVEARTENTAFTVALTFVISNIN